MLNQPTLPQRVLIPPGILLDANANRQPVLGVLSIMTSHQGEIND
jgi:hypothetical protein